MSRSGYSDDYEHCDLWAANVERTIRGKRGQAFLAEMLAALDALPEKKLAAGVLVEDGEYCAMGAVAVARKLDADDSIENDIEGIAELLKISSMLAQEIAYQNDEHDRHENNRCVDETPEQRWTRMRCWCVDNIHPAPGATGGR